MLSASRLRERQEGAVAIFIAIMLVVFLAAVALAVDVGGLYLRRRALVNGSDAAALSAARTCARAGHTPADPFGDPEVAADRQVQLNAPITASEVTPTNVTDRPVVCGDQYGHVTVQYTSQQDLYFAPVLGFDHTSPVTTTATASWGLGSNNPVPTVLSNLFAPGTCQMPPGGAAPHIGDSCTFWYDNDALNGGNFTFLSLNPAGWDVPIGSNCAGSSSGGTSTLTKWINGTLPASVVLNWTYPTYVCTDTGIRGVGGKGGPNSQVWSAFASLKGQIKDFPINWEGCGGTPATPCAPPGSTVVQGTVYQNGNIDKYDIVGFAAMQIDQVYGSTDPAVQGTPPADYTCDRKVPNNKTIAAGTYDWITFGGLLNGGPCTLPSSLPVDSVTLVNVQGQATPADYTYDVNGITVKTPIPSGSNVKFTLHDDATFGACGQPPSNNSAVCIITTWKGSTLTNDYPSDRLDDITIVRLCDLAYNSCLDQRPR